MTDVANGFGQGTEENFAPEVTAPIGISQPSEKSYSSAEVTAIVQRERARAEQSVLKKVTEQPEYIAKKYPDANIPANSKGYDIEDIRRIATEVATEVSDRTVDNKRDAWIQGAEQKDKERHIQRIVDDFGTKVMQVGKSNYSDFDEVISGVELGIFPAALELIVDGIDNSSDVMYELCKDPIKLFQIEQLANTSSTTALKALKSLSDSIKVNKTPSGRIPNSPLSQLRPSTNGADKNGSNSVTDYRKRYRNYQV